MNYIKHKYIDDYNDNKIIISNKNFYCSNCNKRGHVYKKCPEPIISNGIISFFIENFDNNLIPELEKYISKNINNKNIKNIDNSNKIKFLMVQRKHSLGYMEFMRGKYNINNIENIKHLLIQTTPCELNELSTKNFDYLWNKLWNNNSLNYNKNNYYHKEYIISKQKFYNLKINNNDLFSSIKPKYFFNEWGFPKGRREIYETDIVCAMREFEEETGYNENDYIVIDENNIIKENLTGTNNINYRHNYFLAILNKNMINMNKENKEIGDIQFFTLNECLKIIRPYHNNKQDIIKKIHNLIINFLVENNFNI